MRINDIYSKKAGIYKLICTNNGKIYVGKAVNLCSRIKNHKYLKNLKIFGPLQYAIEKHGWDSFEVEILEVFENFNKLTDNIKILERESYYIKLLDSTNRDIGYNVCKYSTDRTGVPCSEETKTRISSGNIGKTHSDEAKDKIRNSRLGKTMSPESKKRLSESRTGKCIKKHSDEANRRKSERLLGKLRPPFSEEWKNNMSKAKIGIPRPQSKESIDKMKQTKLKKRLERELNKLKIQEDVVDRVYELYQNQNILESEVGNIEVSNEK